IPNEPWLPSFSSSSGWLARIGSPCSARVDSAAVASSPPPVVHALAWPGELSGAVRSVEESLAALSASQVDARAWLATANRFVESPASSRFARRELSTEEWRADAWLAPRAVRSLLASVRKAGPGAILHTHGERALLWGRAASRMGRLRHVHTQHGFIANDPRGRRRVRVARQLSAGVDALIAVHPETAEGQPSAQVIPNCLEPEAFRAEALDRHLARRRLGLRDNQRCYLFLGRLSPEKGADTLGVVQARLEENSGAAVLFVAGSGPLARGVEAMSDVRLLGHRNDPANILAAADVVLMPSRSEGLPMVALEAAAIGVPVVGFAVGGLADSALAATVPVDDVGGLVSVAMHLVRNADVSRQRVAAAREALEAQFSPVRHASALKDLYARVASRS
ncbi:MAG: glycosyltransferase family 4 protein, partial [Myxococcota bacterium]|nr:glycosyltransferase family 4 protein [Myxococcota bacterium]